MRCIVFNAWNNNATPYKGIGDFATAAGTDCDINEAAISALSYVDICGATICNLLIIRFFIIRSTAKGTKGNFCSTDSKSLFPVFFLLHGIGDFLFAVFKITGQTRPIVGRDASVTIIAAFLPILCYCGLVLYYNVIMKFLKGYSCMMSPESREKVDMRFASLLSKSELITPLSIIPCFLPLFGLGYPQYVREFGMAYFIGNGIFVICYGGFFYLTLGFLLEELTSYIKTSTTVADDILIVYKRLRLAHRVGTGAFALVGISYTFFGSREYLLRKSSYMLLIIQISTHPTFTVLILTVSQVCHRKVAPVPIKGAYVDVELSTVSHR